VVLVAVGPPVAVAVAVAFAAAIAVAVVVAVAVAVAVAVGVRPGVTTKFLRLGALYTGVTPLAVNNRRANKRMRIQRLANLILCDGDCIFSMVEVTGGTSGYLRNWSTRSLSSFPGYTVNGSRNFEPNDFVTLGLLRTYPEFPDEDLVSV